MGTFIFLALGIAGGVALGYWVRHRIYSKAVKALNEKAAKFTKKYKGDK